MKIIKKLSDDSLLIECGLCEGTGEEPVPVSMEGDEDIDWTCHVCRGKGLLVENSLEEFIFTCARCNGKGKKYTNGYYNGDCCPVCEGRGYVKVKDSPNHNIWSLLHLHIIKNAKKAVEAKNYNDALIRCIKELNIELKEYYKERTGKELDGAALVGALLSVEKPILCVSDLNTESGRNRQKGLLQILQGVFIGIRNPVFHDQKIGYSYCIHSLFILSFANYELDYSSLRSKSE